MQPLRRIFSTVVSISVDFIHRTASTLFILEMLATAGLRLSQLSDEVEIIGLWSETYDLAQLMMEDKEEIEKRTPITPLTDEGQSC